MMEEKTFFAMILDGIRKNFSEHLTKARLEGWDEGYEYGVAASEERIEEAKATIVEYQRALSASETELADLKLKIDGMVEVEQAEAEIELARHEAYKEGWDNALAEIADPWGSEFL